MSRRNDRYDRRNYNSNRDYRSKNDRRPFNQTQNQQENNAATTEVKAETPKKETKQENLAPKIEQPNVKPSEKKFTGRCRLPSERMIEPCYIAICMFQVPKEETRQVAERAKAEIDGIQKDGRVLRVKFASNGAAVKVKNLSPWVTNELLETAFAHFGEIERAVVVVNDRGRPIGEGIVEFAKKQSATAAIKTCTQQCYLLSRIYFSIQALLFSPPSALCHGTFGVMCESNCDLTPFLLAAYLPDDPIHSVQIYLSQSAHDQCQLKAWKTRDEEDGFPEKMAPRNNPEYQKDREMGPRFAKMGTFEHEYAERWKKLYAVEDQKRDFLEKEIQTARRQMEEEMEMTYYDHEANVLREKLRRLEEQASLMQRDREMRLQAERRFDDEIQQNEMMLREQEEEILRPRVQRNGQRNMMDKQGVMPEDMVATGGGVPPQAYGTQVAPNQYGPPPTEQMYGKRPYPEHGGGAYGEESAKRRRY
ncbi:PSPC1 [Cordylochernes scorpioides]|uniref:PSPC1 n=1 Tax=Cordylochernes scorpioides TaxID=51811 RepID=A0ABY6KEP0_9ARAC|nr:PSPC1 [Cordylochernes scorpioides]